MIIILNLKHWHNEIIICKLLSCHENLINFLNIYIDDESIDEFYLIYDEMIMLINEIIKYLLTFVIVKMYTSIGLQWMNEWIRFR